MTTTQVDGCIQRNHNGLNIDMVVEEDDDPRRWVAFKGTLRGSIMLWY